MKRKKCKISILLLGMVLALGVFSNAFASDPYLASFNSANGTNYNCGVCHTTPTGSSSARNSFGADWSNASIGNHSYTITAALASRDSDGDGYTNTVEIQAKTYPGDATSHPASGADTTLPVVTVFTIPTTSTTLNVPITTFTATDSVGVTGYLVNESATKPLASAAGWSASRPSSYTFATAGSKTLYAWAKDAAGNVSTSLSRTITVTVTSGGDTTAPSVTGFTIPSTSSSLAVPITTFTATDSVGVTGYLVNESATKPLASATGWSASRPSSYTFATAGSKTLYAWAKDAAGNVSTSLSRTVTVTVTSGGDTIAPSVTGFTIPSTSSSLIVPITTFTATDSVGVTGYMVNESATKPLASATGWSASRPSSYTFATAGSKTLYAWAKDGAGNVSSSVSAPVTITLASGAVPAITDFQIPLSYSALTVPILSLTANSAVTGYLVTEMAMPVTPPNPGGTGWKSTPPMSYTFGSEGMKALYVWGKDAAGNLSEPWSEMVMITLHDVTPPQVMDFTIASTSNSLSVPIVKFVANDDVGVSGYLITTTSTPPLATASGWRSTPPTGYTFPSGTSGGTKTLYGWAKDAAGNVSTTSLSGTVAISAVTDTIPPVVTAFSIPRSSSSLTVPIRTFAATDNIAVTGYMVTTSSTKPSATSSNWRSTPPTSYTLTSGGTKRLYPWAKDGAGNVSALSNYGTVTITTRNSRRDDYGDD